MNRIPGFIAYGHSSVAMGNSTTASGNSSTSFGSSTKATGTFSMALGLGSVSRSFASLSLGRFNDSIISSDPTNWISTDPVFIIGNGSDDISRRNAMIVLKNANTGINVGNGLPQALLHLKAAEASFDMHIRLENFTNADYASIIYDGSMKFKTFGTDDVFEWRTFDNNTRMSLSQSGNLSIDGTISIPGEINRTATGIANLVPICYGSVSSTAVINSGTGNFSVLNSSTGTYLVSITGESYTNGFITSVSPVSGTSVRIITIGTSGTDLIIRIFDLTGTLVNTAFHFVIYKQ